MSASDSASGLPCSRVCSRASASRRAVIPSPIAWQTFARSHTFTRAHARCAARAAATAASTSSVPGTGTVPMTAPVTGETTSNRSPRDATYSPPMNNRASPGAGTASPWA